MVNRTAGSNPALTVASVSYEKIGYAAAGLVHRRIDTWGDDESLVIKGELVIRASTAPPPQTAATAGKKG
jgi:DNA-binding LacI/PurR family transcriptional regulator